MDKKKCYQQIEGHGSPFLFHSNETPPGALHPGVGPSPRVTYLQRTTRKMVRGVEELSYKDRLKELEMLQPGEGTGKTLLLPFSI